MDAFKTPIATMKNITTHSKPGQFHFVLRRYEMTALITSGLQWRNTIVVLVYA